MLLGRRGLQYCLSALVIATASEPQEVCGAAMDRLRLLVAMQSAHAPECRLRRDQASGTKARNLLRGIGCRLTTGGLIRVRPPTRTGGLGNGS
jgi:hypothetical protein